MLIIYHLIKYGQYDGLIFPVTSRCYGGPSLRPISARVELEISKKPGY